MKDMLEPLLSLFSWISLPTIFQGMYGRPQLKADFLSCDMRSRHVLGCEVWNEIAGPKWIKRDTALSVTGSVTIEQLQARRVIHSAPIEFEGDSELAGPRRRVDIPPGDNGVSIALVDVFQGVGSVHLHYGEPIGPGEYAVFIGLEEGGRSWRFSKKLLVTTVSPYAQWTE